MVGRKLNFQKEDTKQTTLLWLPFFAKTKSAKKSKSQKKRPLNQSQNLSLKQAAKNNPSGVIGAERG
jgi:hypothetical protein